MDTAYQYKARDKFGKLVLGNMTAGSDVEVGTSLKRDGLTPVEIVPFRQKNALNAFAKFRKLKQSDLNGFTREFYTLTKAGLTVLASLEVIRETDRNALFQKIVDGIIAGVRGGSSVSESLERYPKVFNRLYVNMFRAGEISGRMDEVLERILFIGESEEKLQVSIKSALRYPAIVLSAIVIAFFFLTNFVIPRFVQLFSQSKVELPLPTKILLGIHYFTSHYWYLMVLMGIGAFFLFKRFKATPKGKAFLDRLILKIPVFGSLILKAEMSRFSRIMALLAQSGIPALKALEISRDCAVNQVVSDAIERIHASVTAGSGMAQPMKDSGIFPPSVLRMVRVGEETGRIDELLLKVSEYYDMQVQFIVSNLMALIEPMMIVVLGSMVLLLGLGMFLPMWNMISLFRR